MKKPVLYLFKFLAVFIGVLILFASFNFSSPVSVESPPLLNPVRGFAMAVLTIGGLELSLPIWLASLFVDYKFFHAPFWLAGYFSLVATLSSILGAVMAKKIFGGRNPVIDLKTWAAFIFLVVPVLVTFEFLMDVAVMGKIAWDEEFKRWFIVSILGNVLMYPFFMELLNFYFGKGNNNLFRKDLLVLTIGLSVNVCVFYIDFSKLGLDGSIQNYLAFLTALGVALFSSPFGMSICIVSQAYLMIWKKLGLLGFPNLFSQDTHLELQTYLLFMGACVPPIAALLKRSSEFKNLKRDYFLTRSDSDNAEDRGFLRRLGIYSDNTAIGLFDLDYRCLECNQKLADIYGLSVSETVGKSVDDRVGRNAKILRPIFREVVRSKKPVWNVKVNLELYKNAEDGLKHLLISYFPVLSKESKVIAVVAVASSNSSQSQNGTISSEATISQTILHDVQEPLRNLHQALYILNEKLKTRSDVETIGFLHGALHSTSRTRAMIQSSLEMSQLNHIPINRKEFDGSLLINDSLRAFKLLLEEVGAKVVCDPIPKLNGDKKQLVRVFGNLISNSIKYRSDRELVIRLSVKQEGDEIHFVFSDNGIGFESQQAENIFNLFYRLHSFEEREGHGVGLTIEKKS